MTPQEFWEAQWATNFWMLGIIIRIAVVVVPVAVAIYVVAKLPAFLRDPFNPFKGRVVRLPEDDR